MFSVILIVYACVPVCLSVYLSVCLWTTLARRCRNIFENHVIGSRSRWHELKYHISKTCLCPFEACLTDQKHWMHIRELANKISNHYICRGFFGQFLLQQSAGHYNGLTKTRLEGQAPRSSPPTVVLVPLNYKFTPTSVQHRRH